METIQLMNFRLIFLVKLKTIFLKLSEFIKETSFDNQNKQEKEYEFLEFHFNIF
jgi:hypothetical protein